MEFNQVEQKYPLSRIFGQAAPSEQLGLAFFKQNDYTDSLVTVSKRKIQMWIRQENAAGNDLPTEMSYYRSPVNARFVVCPLFGTDEYTIYDKARGRYELITEGVVDEWRNNCWSNERIATNDR